MLDIEKYLISLDGGLRNADRILIPLIPSAGNDHEGRSNGAFGETEEESNCSQTCKILRGT